MNRCFVILLNPSADVLVPNVGCTSCAGDPSGFYAANASKTAQPVACTSPLYHCDACETGTKQCVFVYSFVGMFLFN
jgi:hypothetical protein